MPSGLPFPREFMDPFHGSVPLEFETADEAKAWADQHVEHMAAPVECFTIGAPRSSEFN